MNVRGGSIILCAPGVPKNYSIEEPSEKKKKKKKKKPRNRKRQVDDYARSMWVALDRLQTIVRDPGRRPPCKTQAARPSLGCPSRAQAQAKHDLAAWAQAMHDQAARAQAMHDQATRAQATLLRCSFSPSELFL